MKNEDRLQLIQPFFSSHFPLTLIHIKNKTPVLKSWREKVISDREISKHVLHGGNVGWKLQETDCVIDVDPRNFVEGDNPLERLIKDFHLEDLMENCPQVLTGSGGYHFYCSIPEHTAISNSIRQDKTESYRGIEFKSIGRQVVIPGSVHPSGNLYLLDPLKSNLDALPPIPENLLSKITKQISQKVLTGSTQVGTINPEQLEQLLTGLDVLDFREEEVWRTCMFACHSATKGEGRDEFIAWSISDPQYRTHGGIIRDRWNSLNPDLTTGITIGTLYNFLKEGGQQIPAFVNFDDISKDEQPLTFETKLIDRMNKEWSVLNRKGSVIYRKAYVDGRLEVQEWNKEGFQTHYMSRLEQIGDRKENLAAWWLKQPGRHEVVGVTFDPSNNAGSNYINLWRGFSVEPKKGSWGYLQELIGEAVCGGNSEYEKYILDWMAFCIQYPELPAEVAVVLRGSKGVGKSTIGETLGKLCSYHFQPIVNQKQIFGQFNKHLQDCIFLLCEEAFWAGDKVHQTNSILKSLVTGEKIMIEQKYKDPVLSRNCLKIMITGNEDWQVPASLDERRFAVFDMSTNYFERHEDFWIPLYKQLKTGGGYEALMYDLQNRNISEFHPRYNIPQTQALADQKMLSMGTIEKWWGQKLEDGYLFEGKEMHWDTQEITVRPQDLWDSYRDFLYSGKYRKQVEPRREFIKHLKKLGIFLRRTTVDFRKHYVLRLLPDCQKRFEELTGYLDEW